MTNEGDLPAASGDGDLEQRIEDDPTLSDPENSKIKSVGDEHATRTSSSSKHHFQTNYALSLTLATLCMFLVVSLYSTKSLPSSRRLESDEEYSVRDCSEVYSISDPSSRCDFAFMCNNGEGIPFAPSLFCPRSIPTPLLISMITPPFLLFLVILFRLLGSTAEDFFSPSLEMFSVKLGLPPRFAGVTLLALGNGAADVSATVRAILSNPQEGYHMSLGALTGAGMFVGTVIAGIVIVIAEGVPCRGALVRDVIMYLITIGVVWGSLKSGRIGAVQETAFVVMYCVFVVLVLIADVYHRKVVLVRSEERREVENNKRVAEMRMREEMRMRAEADTLGDIDGSDVTSKNEKQNVVGKVLQALSNYDDNITREGWGIEEEEGQMLLLHGKQGIISKNGVSNTEAESMTAFSTPYHVMPDSPDDVFQEPGIGASSWKGAWYDNVQEFKNHWKEVWNDIWDNDELKFFSKLLLVCELPITILRMITVPIPCDGYYNRSLVGFSILISPLWFAFYLYAQHNVNTFPYFFYLFSITLPSSLLIFRYAPGGDVPMALSIAGPIAFYGFIISATWIDTIADFLVTFLNFLGIVCRIPSSILGITILAWGNSMGDLSANVTMARKGLANMAITACFAGPIFNILIGLGLGFWALNSKLGVESSAVELTKDVNMGFAFLLLNCALVLVSGLLWNKGVIPVEYGYTAMGLYTVYIVASVAVQFA